MATNKEVPINDLLDYPYDAFLMVRYEFVLICQDELEAKLLRIIERYIEQERKNIYTEQMNTARGSQPDGIVEITKDIWVAISHRVFRNDLFGTVTSDNTIKKGLKSLIAKRLIFQRFDQKKRYDAPEYRINVTAVQMLLSVLKSGDQKLIPSIIDTLKKSSSQELTLSEYQKLIPSSDLRGSKIDTNYNKGITDNSNENKREYSASSLHSDAPSSSSSSSVSTSDTQGETNDDPNRHRSLSPVLRPDHPGIGSDSRDCPVSGTALTPKGASTDADTALPARPTDRDEPGNKPDTHPAPLPAVPTQETVETAQGARADALPDASIPAQSGRTTETGVGTSEETEGKKPPAKRTPRTQKQATLLDAPLVEPDMTGMWVAEKVVQYVEYRLGKRYAEKMRATQTESARAIHREEPDITLEQFKQAYDDLFDWWLANQGPLHISDMHAKRKNKVMRLRWVLDRLASVEARRGQSSPKDGKSTDPTTISSAAALLSARAQEAAAKQAAMRAKYEAMKGARTR